MPYGDKSVHAPLGERSVHVPVVPASDGPGIPITPVVADVPDAIPDSATHWAIVPIAVLIPELLPDTTTARVTILDADDVPVLEPVTETSVSNVAVPVADDMPADVPDIL